MNINKVFPSRFLKAEDLNGKDFVLVVRTVVMEKLGSPPNVDEKPVLYFEGAKKGLVLNKTNAMTIASIHGPETDNWKGKKITIYPTQVRAFGKMESAIRVREQGQAWADQPGSAVHTPPPHFNEEVLDEPDLDYPDLDDNPFDDGGDALPPNQSEIWNSAPPVPYDDSNKADVLSMFASLRELDADNIPQDSVDIIDYLTAKDSGSNEPLTPKQYGFLAKLIDEKNNYPDGHGMILSAMLQRPITSEDRPGWAVKEVITWYVGDKNNNIPPNPDKAAAILPIAMWCKAKVMELHK